MQNVKKSFRKTELALLVIGIFIALVLMIALVFRGDSLYSYVEHFKNFLLGYFFCFLVFTISYELFFLFEPNPNIRKWAYLSITNLKLVIIVGLFYYVRLTGISATNSVMGFITCQTLAVFVLLIYAYRSNNLLKPAKKTDSKE